MAPPDDDDGGVHVEIRKNENDDGPHDDDVFHDHGDVLETSPEVLENEDETSMLGLDNKEDREALVRDVRHTG